MSVQARTYEIVERFGAFYIDGRADLGPYPTYAEAARVVSVLVFGKVAEQQAVPYPGPGGYHVPATPVDDPMVAQIEHWFTYHAPAPGQIEAMKDLREGAKLLAHMIVTLCPPSADRTTAIRHLRDAVMTANASIVLGGK